MQSILRGKICFWMDLTVNGEVSQDALVRQSTRKATGRLGAMLMTSAINVGNTSMTDEWHMSESREIYTGMDMSWTYAGMLRMYSFYRRVCT